MATLLHPTNLDDPIQFSKQCNLNDPSPVPKEEEEETDFDRFKRLLEDKNVDSYTRQFIYNYLTSGSYWLRKGDPHRANVHKHEILFNNGTIFVDGKSHGNVSDHENQSFLESLEKFEVPDEFLEDGTHGMIVDKRGEEPARFDAEYFFKMNKMNAWEYGDDGDDGDEMSDSSEEELD